MTLPVLQPRTCGECDACCVVYAITEPEVTKEAHARCGHLVDVGCGIYATRPPTCREFVCLWMRGLGGDEHRPDRCGYVVRDIEHAALAHGGCVAFTELRAGALADGTPGTEAAREAGFSLPVIVTYRDGTQRLIMPSTRGMVHTARARE